MPAERSIKQWLKTPRGTLGLMAASFAVTIAGAIAVASQARWFEARVRETYAPPSAAIDAIGRELRGAEGVARVRGLSRDDQARLYADWVQGRTWPESAPAVMAQAFPEFYLDRSFQTLVAGSAEQRARAAAFLARSGRPEARALLEEAIDRARRRREPELVRKLEAELAWLLAAPATHENKVDGGRSHERQR